MDNINIDAHLWDRFREGDQRAFFQVYDMHVQTLYRYGLKLSNDKELIKDCIHDLFLELSNSRQTISPTDNIKYYLIKSLKYKIFRNNKFAQNSHHSIDEHIFQAAASFDHPFDEQESIKKKRRYLRDAINKLPSRQKEAIYLRYINGLNNEEIAHVMGINNQVVRNTLYKAIENLRKSISKEDLILFLITPAKKHRPYPRL
ncbi:MAG: sigma-70 family RNA polymerase sigma factor [Bacteroidales bacterium]|jgi:RNA polymerase sigma factor (sigma-70 family)|nr:sigma-70 family RNA polymerase sigma factor [Bacteroidales bacterium]